MERVLEERISTADLVKTNDRPSAPAVYNQVDEGVGPLLTGEMVNGLRSRWDQIQTAFVDEPRDAVQRADELVAQAIKALAENFASARNRLEEQWSRGDDVSTEDLRVALKKYRTFFNKLLSV